MLPHKFKIIGFALMLVSMICIVTREFYLEKAQPSVTVSQIALKANSGSTNVTSPVIQDQSQRSDKDMLSFYLKLVTIIGFLSFCISNEKIEDERIDKIRLSAFRISFVISIIIGMVVMILDYYTISISTIQSTVQILLTVMLIVYLLAFLVLRRREGEGLQNDIIL